MTRNLLLGLAALSLLGLAPVSAAETGVTIVVPAHEIERGAIIAPSDLTTATVDANNVLSGTVTRASLLEGMQTRRVLHEGESVRIDDVRAPILVTKGETVTMTFSAPGIVLTAPGRAMSEGGMGESVTVQNPASFRTITATVSGPGAVTTSGAPAAIVAAR